MKVSVVSLGVVGVRAAGNLLGDVYSGSCLEGIIQPQLNRRLVGDLVFTLETSEWHSHLISTSIHAILLGEFLEYEVHFNSDGGSTKDVFYRAAEEIERPDGSFRRYGLRARRADPSRQAVRLCKHGGLEKG